MPKEKNGKTCDQLFHQFSHQVLIQFYYSSDHGIGNSNSTCVQPVSNHCIAGRMKAMMVFMQETSKNLIEYIGKEADKQTPFELKQMLGKYSMDTIASCAFGVDAQAFRNDKSKFVEYAANIFKGSAKDIIRVLCCCFCCCCCCFCC